MMMKTIEWMNMLTQRTLNLAAMIVQDCDILYRILMKEPLGQIVMAFQ
jgi:hypothetical protein